MNSESNSPAAKHLAAGPALGYVYQFQVGLFKLLPFALRADDAVVRLEVLDDVSVEQRSDRRPPEVVQVHQEAGTRSLTDRSEKVWKTLGIWTREWASRDLARDVQMTLFTTQTAQDGSALALLREGIVDRDAAFQQLSAIAAEPDGASGTAADRSAFASLSETQRRLLLERVTLVDGATAPEEMRAQLEKMLSSVHELEYIQSIADLVEGWWWRRVPEALKSGEPIHANELRAQIDHARRRHSTKALPIFRAGDFGEDELPPVDAERSRFLTCLIEIAAHEKRRAQAVDDYRLSYSHRSRWARRGLLLGDEIERYEEGLRVRWTIGCDRMLRDLGEEKDLDRRREAGHQLWDEMEIANHPPLRVETADTFIQRGSFHQLAEDEKVAWHPDVAATLYDGEREEAA